MVRNILVLLSIVGLGLVVQAQESSLSKKVYIINQAHESSVKQSADPVQTIQQIDRVEMDVAAADNTQSAVLVKRCGTSGCLSALAAPVRMDDLSLANSKMDSRTSKDFGKSDCRVCVAPTAADLGTYIKELNSTLKGMGALK